MASKANTKFVVILSILLLALVLGIAAAYVFFVRRNPARYIARAQALIAEGNYEDGLRQYGRAYRYERDPADQIEILKMWASDVKDWEAENTFQARERLRQWESCWATIRSQIDETHSEAIEKMLNVSYERAKIFSYVITPWDQLYNLANEILELAPENDLARRYRGIAQVMRMDRVDMAEENRNQARRDLEAVQAENPEDAELQYHLARWYWVESKYSQRMGRINQAAEQRATAEQMMRDFVAGHPDSLEGRYYLMELLFAMSRHGQHDQNDQLVEEVLQRARALAEDVVDAEDAEMGINVAFRLIRLGDEPIEATAGSSATTVGAVEAQELLKALGEAHPDNMQIPVLLGRLLRQQGRVDEAIKYFQYAKADRPIPITPAALELEQHQTAAVKELADLYLYKFNQAEGPEARAKYLAMAREQVADLAERAPGSGWVLLLEGKLAMVDGDLRLASKKLDEANRQFEGQNAEVLQIGASVAMQLDQPGRAKQLLQQYLDVSSSSGIEGELSLARMELSENDLAAAERHLERILREDPTNTEALVLSVQLLTQRAAQELASGGTQAQMMIEQALALIDQLEKAMPDDRRLVFQRVRLHQLAKDTETAHEVLAGYYEQHPEDMLALQELVKLERQLGMDERAVARLEEAAETHPDRAETLQMWASAMRGEQVDVSGLIEQRREAAEAEADPVMRALKLYQFHVRSGDQEKAAEYFAEAAELAPDNEQVLRIQFARALSEKDWDKAQRIVDRVARLNEGEGLDLAKGRYWLGQLRLAQGQVTEAVQALEQAVSSMPVDFNMWLLLGDARRAAQDIVGAENAYRRAVELKPDAVPVWQRMFLLHDMRGQTDEALRDLQQMLHFSRGNARVYMQYLAYLGEHGDKQLALNKRLELAEEQPDNQANQRAIAQLYMQLNQPDKAKTVLDELLAEHPDDPANVSNLAEYLRTQGRFEEGKQILKEFVLGKGDQATSRDWMFFARYLRRGGDVETGVAAYRKAAELADDNKASVQSELADWFSSLERNEDAAEMYQQVLESTEGENVKAWVRYVDMLLKMDKAEEADAEMRRLVDAHGRTMQIALLQGRVADRLGRTAEAGEAHDMAVHLAPANPLPYVQRAAYRLQHDSPSVQQLGVADLQKAISLDPTHTLAREMLIQSHLRDNNEQAAVEELERFVQAVPDYGPARVRLAEMYLQRGAPAFGDLERLLRSSEQQFPDQAAWDQLWARLYSAQGRNDAALERLASAYEKQKSPAMLLAYLNGQLDADRPDEVLELLGDWAELTQRSSQLQAIRARAVAMQGKVDEAIRLFRVALKTSGDNVNLVNDVIRQARQALPADQMLVLIESAVDDDPTGQIELLVCRYWVGQGRLSEAIERLRAMHAREPQRNDVLQMLAAACYAAGERDAAQQYYRTIVDRLPDNLTALNNLAFLLAEDETTAEQAIPLAERAVEVVGREAARADRANVLDTLGYVLYRAGRLEEAQNALRQSIDLAPMVPNHKHLGLVFIAKDQPESARRELMSARQIAEQNNDRAAIQEIDELLGSLEATAARAER